MKNNTKAILLVLICVVIASVGQILLKLGSESFSLISIQSILSQITNIPLIIGIIFYAIAAGVMILAFRLGDLSVVYPVMALNYVVVSVLSKVILAEQISGQRIMGLILICIGVIFIGTGGAK